jgi:hypothetical protein
LTIFTFAYAQNDYDDSFVVNRAPLIEQQNNNSQQMDDPRLYFGQGLIYYDAVRFASENNDAVRGKILERYGIINEEILNANPFLNGLLVPNAWNKSQGAVSFFSSLGNANVTSFATGVSRFLAERAKDELNEAFFKRMKKYLNKYDELQTIFPASVQILNKIEHYHYAYIIQILKDAFETDMRNLPQNFYAVKHVEKLKDFFETLNGKWMSLSLFTLKETHNATNPAILWQTIIQSDEFVHLKNDLKPELDRRDEYNLLSFIELSQMFSQSFISTEDDRVWITTQQFESLMNPDVLRIYLGLLYATEQNNSSNLYFYTNAHDTTSFSQILFNIWKYYEQNKQFGNDIKSFIKNIYAVFNKSNAAVKNIQLASQNVTQADPAALYTYYRLFPELISQIFQNIKSFVTISDSNIKNIEKLTGYLYPAFDMVYHVTAKKYSSAVLDATVLLDFMLKDSSRYKDLKQSFLTYGILIADIATAQTSDEVKKAIEATVLPVGSSAMKRNSNWSIMMNAYVGAYYGGGKNKEMGKFQSYGLYAPIGLSFSKGFYKGGALSLTVNVIELGSLVNIYLSEGDNVVLPDNFRVKLIDIFSPGIQLSYLIPKTPVAFLIGANYIPQLFSIPNNKYKGGMRFQTGLTIDIPMYKIALKQ